MCGTVFAGDATGKLLCGVPDLRVRDGGANGVGEQVRGEFSLRDRCGAGAEFLEAPRPEGLITYRAWHRDRWNAGAQTGRGGPGSSMMDHRGHPGKEPGVGDLSDAADPAGHLCLGDP